MIRHPVFFAALVSVSVVSALPAFAQAVPAYVTAAVDDAGRPAADKARDADRKPADLIAFSNMKPGDKVADFVAGGGYFTRLFSKVVGPAGHVYATAPEAMVALRPAAADGIKAIAADPAYSNVTVMVQPTAKLSAPEKLDIVWTAQNYHDLHNTGPFSANGDMDGFNKSVFDALKPGGEFLVIDYSAAAGTGFTQSQALHRGDQEAEKAEILKAGFVFEAESNVLRNAGDPRTARTHEKDDQFVMRFRKPR